MSIIKPGYRISVSTYEDDGDNWKKAIYEGLSEEETACIVKICKLLKYGEIDNGGEELKQISYEFHISWERCDDILCELDIYSDYDFCRRCDEYIVEYVPEEIILEDVTDRF